MPKQREPRVRVVADDRVKYRLTLHGLRQHFESTHVKAQSDQTPIDFDSVEGLQCLTPAQRRSFFCTWSHNRKFKQTARIPRASTAYSFLKFAIIHDNAAVVRQFFDEALTEFRQGRGTDKIAVLNKRCARGFSLAHFAAQHGASEVLGVLKHFFPQSLFATVDSREGGLAGASVVYVAAYYNQYSVFDYLEQVLTKNFIRPQLECGGSLVDLAILREDKALLDLIWRKDRSALYDPLSDGRLPIYLAIDNNCIKSLGYVLSLKHSKSDLHPFMTNKTALSEFLNPECAEKNIAFYLTSSLDMMQHSVASMRCVYATVSSNKKKSRKAKKKSKEKTIFSAVDEHGNTPRDRIINALGLNVDDSVTREELYRKLDEFYALDAGDLSDLRSVLAETTNTSALSL